MSMTPGGTFGISRYRLHVPQNTGLAPSAQTASQLSSSRRCARPTPEAGFTLVELLMTLAILSLMVVYGWGAVTDLFRMNSQLTSADSQAEVDAAARFLRDEIADMRVVFTRDQNNAPRLMFAGNEHDLGFVAVANGERETGGLYWVHYRVNEKGNFVSERRLLRNQSMGKAQTIILLRNVTEVGFTYSGIASNAPQEMQIPRWDQEDRLPQAIDVEIVFAARSVRRWPPLSSAVAASQ